MIGELGAFFLDERQIGGLLNWELDFGKEVKVIGFTDRNFPIRKIKQKDWGAIAQGWWLLEPFSPERSYLTKFYIETITYEGRAVLAGIKNVMDELIMTQVSIKGQEPLRVKIGGM